MDRYLSTKFGGDNPLDGSEGTDSTDGQRAMTGNWRRTPEWRQKLCCTTASSRAKMVFKRHINDIDKQPQREQVSRSGQSVTFVDLEASFVPGLCYPTVLFAVTSHIDIYNTICPLRSLYSCWGVLTETPSASFCARLLAINVITPAVFKWLNTPTKTSLEGKGLGLVRPRLRHTVRWRSAQSDVTSLPGREVTSHPWQGGNTGYTDAWDGRRNKYKTSYKQ